MNIGLVLTGGGMRGAAHMGAIKALEEHDIFLTHMAGRKCWCYYGVLICIWLFMANNDGLLKTIQFLTTKIGITNLFIDREIFTF